MNVNLKKRDETDEINLKKRDKIHILILKKRDWRLTIKKKSDNMKLGDILWNEKYMINY